MSDDITIPAPTSRVDRVSALDSSPSASGGTTTIADGVVSKVAGIAAREVPGVYALGGGGARAIGAVRNLINANDVSQGVKVEVGETQAAVDVVIVVDYPTPVHQVAAGVRAAITTAIETLVGLQVVEVNVDVNDVHLPDDNADDSSTESRVS